MTRNARLAGLCAALALLSLSVAACGSSSGGGGGGGGGNGGGLLRIGDAGSKIDTYNPFVSVNSFGYFTDRYIYPYLLQYDATTTNLVGDFATKFTPSADGRTWTYELRPGAKWSDGQPLTSDDVVWTINTALKYADGAGAALATKVPGLKSAVAEGPTKVTLTYASASASAQSLLAQLPILPRHQWESHVGAGGKGLRTFLPPVPTVSGGAFQLQKYDPDSVLIFRRNASFYGAKPKLSGFGLQFFGSQDAMVSALRQGRLDVGLEVPPLTVKSLAKDPGLKISTPPSPDVVAVVVNANAKKTDHPELKNPLVRQAMSLSFDRDALVRVVTNGEGKAVTTLIPPTIPKWSGEGKLPPLTRDVAKANAMLDQLGYTRGADGVRVANGHKMEYAFNYCACYGDRPQATIKSDLAAIGIKIDVKSADAKAFIGAYSDPDNKWTKYDMGLFDDQAQPDPETFLDAESCAQRGNSNFTYFCDPKYEQMLAQQRTQLDEGKRLATVLRMQSYIRTNGAWLPLYSSAVPVAVRANVAGFRPSPLILDTLSRAQLSDASVAGK